MAVNPLNVFVALLGAKGEVNLIGIISMTRMRPGGLAGLTIQKAPTAATQICSLSKESWMKSVLKDSCASRFACMWGAWNAPVDSAVCGCRERCSGCHRVFQRTHQRPAGQALFKSRRFVGDRVGGCRFDQSLPQSCHQWCQLSSRLLTGRVTSLSQQPPSNKTAARLPLRRCTIPLYPR